MSEAREQFAEGPGGILLPGKISLVVPRRPGLVAARDISATYLGSTLAMWQSRANTAYDSGVWATGTTWQAHANTAYDSGVWGTGNHFQTLYNNEVTAYNNEVTAYNNEVTAYNNLLNGLNNPEGLQQQGFAISHNAGGGDTALGTFTFGRAGHFLVAVIAPMNGPAVTQDNAYGELRLTGAIVSTMHAAVGTTSGGSRNWWHGVAQDVNVAAGATISLVYNAFVTGNPTTGTATVYAHFVPDSTHHN